jgi:hypothetical protein
VRKKGRKKEKKTRENEDPDCVEGKRRKNEGKMREGDDHDCGEGEEKEKRREGKRG